MSSELHWEISSTDSAIILLSLGGMLAAAGMRGLLGGIWRHGSRVGLILALLILPISIAPISPTLKWAALYPAIGTPIVMALAWALYRGCFVEGSRVWAFLTKVGRGIFQSRRGVFLAVVLGLHFLATNLVSLLIFEHVPHVVDAASQLFQAKMFIHGRAKWDSPPLPKFFKGDWMTTVSTDGWYSHFPPGHTAMLAVGQWMGMPWLVNPALGALTLLVLYLVGREMYSERVGRLAALIGMLSPFVLFMSSEFMNHATALLSFSLFLLFFARAARRGSLVDGVLAGLALGWMADTRPFSALLLALPFAVYMAGMLVVRFRKSISPAIGMWLGIGVMVALFMLFNKATTGDPFVMGYQKSLGTVAGPGFGSKHAPGSMPPHTVLRGIMYLFDSMVSFNKNFLEWPIPALLLMAVPFVVGTRNRWDWLLLICSATLLVGHVPYFGHDLYLGPRFTYEACVPVALLTARGLLRVPTLVRWSAAGKATGKPRFAGPVALGVACVLLAMVSGYPQRLWTMIAWPLGYGRGNAHILRTVEQQGIGNAIIFVNSAYPETFAANEPDLQHSSVIYAVDLGDQNRKLMVLFPGRRYFVERDTKLIEVTPDSPRPPGKVRADTMPP